jgi:hypothetical protein
MDYMVSRKQLALAWPAEAGLVTTTITSQATKAADRIAATESRRRDQAAAGWI